MPVCKGEIETGTLNGAIGRVLIGDAKTTPLSDSPGLYRGSLKGQIFELQPWVKATELTAHQNVMCKGLYVRENML